MAKAINNILLQLIISANSTLRDPYIFSGSAAPSRSWQELWKTCIIHQGFGGLQNHYIQGRHCSVRTSITTRVRPIDFGGFVNAAS